MDRIASFVFDASFGRDAGDGNTSWDFQRGIPFFTLAASGLAFVACRL